MNKFARVDVDLVHAAARIWSRRLRLPPVEDQPAEAQTPRCVAAPDHALSRVSAGERTSAAIACASRLRAERGQDRRARPRAPQWPPWARRK